MAQVQSLARELRSRSRMTWEEKNNNNKKSEAMSLTDGALELQLVRADVGRKQQYKVRLSGVDLPILV